MVVRVFEESPFGETFQDELWFPPGYRRPPRESDARVGQNETELVGNVDETKCHACAYSIDDFVEKTEAMLLVDLLPQLREFG